MDLKDYVKEGQRVFKQLNPTIDKTSPDDAEGHKEGKKELEKLRGEDEAIPFTIDSAHQIEYDYTGSPEDAQKTVEEYKRIVNEGYASVARNIQGLEARLKN